MKLASNLSSDTNKSSKYWWNLCKFLYSKKTSHASIPSLILDGNMITDDTEKAESFNDYFSSISNIHVSDDDLVEFETVALITDLYIAVQDVTDIINSLKTNKACGHDPINHRLLKE